MEALFDYTDKLTPWIKSIRDQYTAIMAARPGVAIYEKIVASAKAELKKRGED